EFLLAALDDPGLLNRFDMIGNRLDPNIDDHVRSLKNKRDFWGTDGANRRAASYLEWESEDPKSGGDSSRDSLRRYSPEVGADQGWEGVSASHKKPVPFDEPTLAIVGMWRYGGGANPHFALALGEIMARIGQRHIAWTAFERAAAMSDHVSGNRAVAEAFRFHCRRRQEW